MSELATFAAGCFWGVEETFRRLPGVEETAVGYTGGQTRNPTYREVCSGGTGHAEAVQVRFDPEQIPYEKLLELFWELHDPTTLNRQGPDIGSQYRSAIFTYSPEQQAAAESSKQRQETSGRWNRPIVTEIVPASEFWRAEEYHQQYIAKGGGSGCAMSY